MKVLQKYDILSNMQVLAEEKMEILKAWQLFLFNYKK